MGTPERDIAQAGDGHEAAVCVQVDRSSDPFWVGWIADRVDEPGVSTQPEIALFQLDRARHEFALHGPRLRG